MSNQQPSLAAKLANIYQTIRAPKRSGEHFHGWEYATKDDVYNVIRSELAERNIAIFCSCECLGLSGDGKKTHAKVRLTVELVDGDSAEERTMIWDAEGSTSEGTSIQNGSTQAFRYWAEKNFMLSTGEDDQAEQTSPNHQVHDRQKPAPTGAQAKTSIRKRLQDLEFSGSQVSAYLQYIAKAEGCESFDDIDDNRAAAWAGPISRADDATMRKKVLGAIGQNQAA